MFGKINRVPPRIDAANMVHHSIIAPLPTHWRKATCAEIDCSEYQNGWMLYLTGVPADDVELAKRRRRCVQVDTDAGPALMFEAGQPCFRASEHRARTDRPELFVFGGGDWRGNPRQTDPVIFSGADPFVDHLHTHLDKFAE